MQIFTLLKSFPKRILLSLNRGIAKIQQFHHNNRLTTAELKQTTFKYINILKKQSNKYSLWFKRISQTQIFQRPLFSFYLYIILWIFLHYLVDKVLSYKIKEYNGRGILEAISHRIAEKNKPLIMSLLDQKLFSNQKIKSQIAKMVSSLSSDENIHYQLQKALSNLITSQFIKMNASKVSIYGLERQIMQNITEKHLKKLVIHLVNDTYIRQLIKQTIIQYLRGESFEDLVITQLANLVQMSYTKMLLTQLIRSSFQGVVKDPYTRILFIEGIKEWLM